MEYNEKNLINVTPRYDGMTHGAGLPSGQERQDYTGALGDMLGQGSSGGSSLFDYARGIFKRKLIILLVTILGAATAILYLQHTSPRYVSMAKIEIERVTPSAKSTNDFIAAFGRFDLYYRTQMEALKSRDVAAEFIRLRKKSRDQSQDKAKPSSQAKSKDTDYSKEPTGDKATPKDIENMERRRAGQIGGVLGRVSVAPVRGTNLISVTMSGSDPLETRDALNTYLEAFILVSNRKRDEVKEKIRTWIDHELNETKKTDEKSRNRIA